jgi:hypothetical protein
MTSGILYGNLVYFVVIGMFYGHWYVLWSLVCFVVIGIVVCDTITYTQIFLQHHSSKLYWPTCFVLAIHLARIYLPLFVYVLIFRFIFQPAGTSR